MEFASSERVPTVGILESPFVVAFIVLRIIVKGGLVLCGKETYKTDLLLEFF